MSVTLIGGMDRLHSAYQEAACAKGHNLKCIARNERNFIEKIGSPDALIIFTNKISHEAKQKALRFAKSRQIPVRMIHACGVSSLRACLP